MMGYPKATYYRINNGVSNLFNISGYVLILGVIYLACFGVIFGILLFDIGSSMVSIFDSWLLSR